jgi:Mg2+/Co2+ transporter CorB
LDIDRRRCEMLYANSGLRVATLALSLVIVSCLAVAALAGVFNAPQLAYFWYLALAGMAAMMLVSLFLAVSWLLNKLTRHYQQLLHHWGDGLAGH